MRSRVNDIGIHGEIVEVNRYDYNKMYSIYNRYINKEFDFFNENLANENNKLKKNNERLQSVLDSKMEELANLKNRNFIQRLFKIDGYDK